jgi:beta-lactamase regulating signal transducer with metallopeptidase domain
MPEVLTIEGLTEAAGWALVHSAWQGALVALLYAAFAAAAAQASAQVRYLAACAALALMLLLPVATAAINPRPAPHAPTRERAADFGPSADEAEGRGRAGARGKSAPPPHAPAARGGAADAGRGLLARVESRVVSLFPWLVACWLTGVALLALRSGGGWLALRRLRRSAEPVAAEFEQAFGLLAARLRASPAVRLCQSALVEVPTVVGHLRPVVLVPLSALVGLTPRQLEAVLAHELAHVRRYDFLINLLQTAAETLLFYHPAAWWVSRRARLEREHAADDAAVAAVGDALFYARALATTEALRPSGTPVPGLALAANGGSLMRRIDRLVGPRPAHGGRSLLAALALVAASLGGVMAAARAVVPPESAAEPGSPPASAAGRQVAVTFVNFPGNFYDAGQLLPKTRQLISRLAAHEIKAVAFVNEMRLYGGGAEPDAEKLNLLREWLDAGHELGNETFGHKSLYRTAPAEWRADVERGELLMSKLLAERGGRLRYFSYPYLNTGPNAAGKKAAEEYLRGRGYEIHPVTVDNMDWLFNRAYGEALREGDEARAARIRAEYVPYMERMFEFYEGYSREVVGREFPQVLMLTGGALNADAIDELVAMMKRRGYSFVTMEEATKDAAYRTPDNYTGERGDSWIARWAVSKGMRYRDTEEVNLPPAMQKYFEEFRRRMKAKGGKR